MKPTWPVVAPEGGCERLACCIPFCRRTFRNDKKGTPWPKGSQVMCGKCARKATPEVRARRRRVGKLYRKAERLAPDTPNRERLLDVISRWDWDLWNLAKLQVTERTAGIA